LRFCCPNTACKHTWTSGLGQFAAIIDQTKFIAFDEESQSFETRFSVKFRVIAYWFNCKKCGKEGDMKSYEDEMERIASITTEDILKKFGFIYEKELKS